MQRTVTILLSIVLLLGGRSAHAQVMATQRTASDDRALSVPSQDAAYKEKLLIREVLEPELILRVDTVKSKIIRTNIAVCLLYTSPSPRDLSTSRMPSSA